MLSLSKPDLRTNQESGPAIPKGRSWLDFVAMQVLLFLCYLPALSRKFAFCDDYYYLARSLRDKDWLLAGMREALLQGRPIDGLILDLSFSCLHRVDELVFLRIAGIFGAGCVAFCSYKLLVSVGWARIQSFCLALCFATVPAFQVYIAWAVAAPHVFPALGACFAVVMAETAAEKGAKAKINLLLAATLCMFLAVGLYQPSAMYFWLFAAMLLFKPTVAFTPNFKERAKLLSMLFVVFGGACALELSVFESAKRFFGTAALLPQRSHLTTHLAAKINWFFCGPFVDAANFQRLQPSIRTALFISLFIALGLFLYFKGNFRQRLAQWMVAFYLIPLSYLPNLAIAENFVTYRTEAGLAALLVFYVFLASTGLIETLNKKAAYPAIAGLSIIAALMSLSLANYNVNTFFVTPQTLELGLIKSQLAGAFGAKLKAAPVSMTRDDTLAPFSRYDEFGLPSMCQPWVPEPILFLLKQGLVEPRSSQTNLEAAQSRSNR